METKKLLIFVLTSAMLSLFSCEKDFLERSPLSDITPANYLIEESQLAAYAINQYGVFPTHQNFSYGTFGNDGNTDNQVTLSYDNRFVPGQWKVAQTGGDWDFGSIYQCNYFLQTVLPRLKAGKITGNGVHYIGEMYAIRAFVYFGKLQALGDFPIIKTVLPDNKEALIAKSKRAPQNEVARFIISDLDSAVMLLNPIAPDGKGNRISKAVALLLKSRVALYEATWLKYFKGTAFVPNGTGWPGKDKDYNANYNFPSGSIDNEIDYFLTQAMDAAKQVADATPLVINNGVLQQKTTDAVNPYHNMFSDVDLSGYSEVLLWRRYDKGLGITHNVVVSAQGGNNATGVTKGMVDAFVMANGLPIYAPGSGYAGDDSISVVRKDRDGRLWLFLKEPKQINVLFPNALGSHAIPIEGIPDITSNSWQLAYPTGYALRKGNNYDAIQCGNGLGYTGSIVFRAVEAYLNYMEACFEKTGGLDGTAQDYWRKIRIRAGVDPDYQKTINATIMSSEANDWGAYSAGNLVDPTLYNIRRERRCELMAEGLRQMDLRRWRAMDQLITAPYHIEGFKLWGPMKKWYDPKKLTYGGSSKSKVSDPSVSLYIRPFEKISTSLAYNGFRWTMAHYLNPIAIQHFMLTTDDGTDLTKSPIYQNPGWTLSPNTAPTGF